MGCTQCCGLFAVHMGNGEQTGIRRQRDERAGVTRAVLRTGCGAEAAQSTLANKDRLCGNGIRPCVRKRKHGRLNHKLACVPCSRRTNKRNGGARR
jgi:hypothetical protein